ncbi:UNVERIFIED_CONTAM: hypothetical protein DES50_102766 [Williamsia faeni]
MSLLVSVGSHAAIAALVTCWHSTLPDGWKQLGGRTLVDGVAALLAGLGVEGCSDPLGKVKFAEFLDTVEGK